MRKLNDIKGEKSKWSAYRGLAHKKRKDQPEKKSDENVLKRSEGQKKKKKKGVEGRVRPSSGTAPVAGAMCDVSW